MSKLSSLRCDKPSAVKGKPIGEAEIVQLRAEFPGAEMCEVVELYRQEAHLLLEQLANASAALNPEALSRAAHTLRGACANFGASPLATLCERLEKSARRGRITQAASLVDQVHRESHRVEVALQRECPAHLS